MFKKLALLAGMMVVYSAFGLLGLLPVAMVAAVAWPQAEIEQ